jgi:hypothetical protein
MRRWVAIVWHASFFILAGVLYFFFVLPRWFELTGAWTSTLGNPLRIVDGVLIGLCALPVVFTLLHTRKPEFGTPQLALSLRLWSIVLHVLAGVLVAGTAVAEIWISLDRAGQWLFGIYGAAAAIAVLGALAFYLGYLAELPPPPPKPIKPRTSADRRDLESSDDSEDDSDATQEQAPADSDEPESEAVTEKAPPVFVLSVADTSEDDSGDSAEPADDPDAEDESAGKLRNRRPAAKPGTRRFLRRRGGVGLDE